MVNRAFISVQQAAVLCSKMEHALKIEEVFMERAVSTLQDVLHAGNCISETDCLSELNSGGYRREFLFGDGLMSAWMFGWPPDAATPIHDHHCPCIFAVVEGKVQESTFEAVGCDLRVRFLRSDVRQKGYIGVLRTSARCIHQMRNIESCPAVTVHIYGFNERSASSSIDKQYKLRN